MTKRGQNYSGEPLSQSICPQRHRMSEVSASPSQYVLQYELSGRAWQRQLG